MKIKNKALQPAFVESFEVEAHIRKKYLEAHPALPDQRRLAFLFGFFLPTHDNPQS